MHNAVELGRDTAGIYLEIDTAGIYLEKHDQATIDEATFVTAALVALGGNGYRPLTRPSGGGRKSVSAAALTRRSVRFGPGGGRMSRASWNFATAVRRRACSRRLHA